MTVRAFVVRAEVPVAPDATLDFLADLARHRDVHPFLVSALVVARGDDWQEWQVLERVPVGPLRAPLRFRARLARPATDLLVTDVEVRPGIRIRTRLRAEPSAQGGTRLLEETSVTAPPLLAGYVAGRARSAHARTFALLPRALAPGSP